MQFITTNKLRNFHRRRARQPQVVGGSSAQKQIEQWIAPFANEDLSTEAQAKQSVLVRALNVMKTEFEETTCRAFWLTVIDRKETREIFETLGKSSGVVRQARSTVRNRLALELHELEYVEAPLGPSEP